MRKMTSRATAIIMAAAFAGVMGCDPQNPNGCGPATNNSASNAFSGSMQCGPGTVLDQATRRCVQQVSCGAGTVLNTTTNQCVPQ